MNTEFKDYLKSINLKDFAERHYGVTWTGNKTLCCYPDHHEKTSSMYYVEDGNYIFCQGCKEGGDIFTFVSLMEKLNVKDDFVEIMKKICELENIQMPRSNKPIDPEIENLLYEKTSLAINFKEDIWANKGGYGFNYLLDRGLTDNTINTFHLGETKSKSDFRYSKYISKKGTMDLSNRITIPILNHSGKKVVAISFRDLGDSKDYKYIHDSSDKVFNKKELFYGYSHAVKYIKEKKHCYIVEGYFDMISMYQAGMKNTLASMTNEMSEEQLKILSKITKDITIIIDQDRAGLNGFIRTFALMLNLGFNVRIVTSLNYLGKDINELCNKLNWDTNKIKDVINSNSRDAVLYYIGIALDKFDDNFLSLREEVMKYSDNILSCISDPIKRKNYESYVANRLYIESWK